MDFKEHFHKNAQTFIENTATYKTEYIELIQTIESISDFDLVKEFNSMKQTSNAQSEKSLAKPINNIIKNRLIRLNWKPEVEIFRDDEFTKGKRMTTWRLDFAKDKLSVEVGFNHGGSIAHNLIKPTLASSKTDDIKKEISTDVAVLVAATEELKKVGNFDGAVGTYEKILTYLKPYNQFLTAPLVIIGLSAPRTFFIDKKLKEVTYLT